MTATIYDLKLTERERDILMLVLRVDLDALGVERKDHAALRMVLKKLKAMKP